MRSQRSLLVVVLSAVGLATVACSGAEPTKKVPFTVCEDGDEACAKAKDNRPKSGKNDDEVPSGPTTTPVPGEEPKEPTADAAAPDASDGGGAMPKSCTALDACCAQLVQQGYDPATCKSVVSTKNDAACFAQHDRYKQFGDCS